MLRLSVSREGYLPRMALWQLSFIWNVWWVCLCLSLCLDRPVNGHMCRLGEVLWACSERKCKFRDELWVDVEGTYFAWDLTITGLRRCYWYSTGTVGGMQLNVWRPCILVSVAVAFPSLIMSMRKSSIDAFPLRYDIQGYDMKLMLLRRIMFLWLSQWCEMFWVRGATA